MIRALTEINKVLWSELMRRLFRETSLRRSRLSPGR